MTPAFVAALAGLVVSLAGSILLAFSLNRLLEELTLTAQAHDLTIQQLAHPTSEVVVFTGLESHLEKGESNARQRTFLGVLLVGLGSVLQALAILLSL